MDYTIVSNISIWLTCTELNRLKIAKEYLKYIDDIKSNQYYWKLRVQNLYANCKQLSNINVNWKQLCRGLEINKGNWMDLLNTSVAPLDTKSAKNKKLYKYNDITIVDYAVHFIECTIIYLNPAYISVALEVFDDWTIFNNHFLFTACKLGFYDIVETLLTDNTLNPSANNNYALCLASANNHKQIVKLLVNDSRTNPALPYYTHPYDDFDGITPLSVAARVHDVDIFKELLKCDQYTEDHLDEIIAISAWNKFYRVSLTLPSYSALSLSSYPESMSLNVSSILSSAMSDVRIDTYKCLKDYLAGYNEYFFNHKAMGVKVLNLVIKEQCIIDRLSSNEYNGIFDQVKKLSIKYRISNWI